MFDGYHQNSLEAEHHASHTAILSCHPACSLASYHCVVYTACYTEAGNVLLVADLKLQAFSREQSHVNTAGNHQQRHVSQCASHLVPASLINNA